MCYRNIALIILKSVLRKFKFIIIESHIIII